MNKKYPSEIHIFKNGDGFEAQLYRGADAWQMVPGGSGECGNFYKGRIVKRLNAHNCLVDIGLSKPGLLDAPASFGEGQSVLVQADRDGGRDKGVGLTLNWQLVGRYTVLKADQKITRTAGKGADKNILEKAFATQAAQFENVKNKYEQAQSPGLLMAEMDWISQMLRDTPDVSTIAVYDLVKCEELKRLAEEHFPDLSQKIEFSRGFDAEKGRFAETRESLSERRQKMFNGAELLVEEGETLAAIDIDQANASGTHFTINRELCGEIARQIVLRNIGGIVMIDFLRMKNEGEREETIKELQAWLSFDALPSRIMSFTQSGVLEMTRPRRGPKWRT